MKNSERTKGNDSVEVPKMQASNKGEHQIKHKKYCCQQAALAHGRANIRAIEEQNNRGAPRDSALCAETDTVRKQTQDHSLFDSF
ncbi:hypothetical protein EBU99_01310 [bacterium]|nr:hypothetical protein [bacterium]